MAGIVKYFVFYMLKMHNEMAEEFKTKHQNSPYSSCIALRKFW